MERKLIIGAPFGNYWRVDGVISTLGTFTLHRRAGPLLRAWRILSTVRPYSRMGAWINKLGLPNPGIDALQPSDLSVDSIVSLYGSNGDEWLELKNRVLPLVSGWRRSVELNLSCPNVIRPTDVVHGCLPAASNLLELGVPVIAKLPPLRWFEMVSPLRDAGVNIFHCCNTIPTPGGGLSGKPLKQYSLWAVEELRRKYGETIKLIGGGGVTCVDDVDDYVGAGADCVSVASLLLNPFSWNKVTRLRDRLASYGRNTNL